VFATKPAAVATPFASVQAVVVGVVLSVKAPLAALGTFVEESVNAGAVKVTTALGTGFGGVLASITVTESGMPKAVPAVAVCGVVPAFVVIVAGLIVFDKSNVAIGPLFANWAVTV
jgi:hypothetical protein